MFIMTIMDMATTIMATITIITIITIITLIIGEQRMSASDLAPHIGARRS